MSLSLRRNAGLYVLLLTVFIDMVGFGIIIPFMPFWAEHFGAAPDMVTLLFATYSAFAFVFSFIWGWISDRWGRKPVLLLALCGSVASFAWLGMADSLWMLFAARALGGVFGANIAVAQAYIADVTRPEDRARGMGLMGAAFGLGFTLGPAIGGILAGADAANPDFRTPFFAAAAISALGVLFGLVFLREPPDRAISAAPGGFFARFRGFALVMGRPAVALPMVVMVMMSFSMAGLESTFALWTERAHGWGPRETGYFFAYIGLMLVIIQGGLIGFFVRNLGEARAVPLSVAILGCGIGMIPWCDTDSLVYLSGALIALGIGVGSPMLSGLISRNAPADIQGAVMGASQSAQSLCRILGPVTAGVLFAAFGRDMPFMAGGVALFATVLVALPIIRTRPAMGSNS